MWTIATGNRNIQVFEVKQIIYMYLSNKVVHAELLSVFYYNYYDDIPLDTWISKLIMDAEGCADSFVV